MRTQPHTASQLVQQTPADYDPVLSSSVPDSNESTQQDQDEAHAQSDQETSEAVDAVGNASVGESAGVSTGGVSSHSATQDNPAGVIAGGLKVLGQRVARTRYPWLDDFMVHMAGEYHHNGRALYDISELTEVVVPDGEDRFIYFVDLFFQKRFYMRHRDMRYDPTARSSPESLAEAWSEFVTSMVTNQASWMQNFDILKKGFMNRNISGLKIQVHLLSIQEGVPCCVLKEQRCPMCYPTSVKATKVLRKNEFGQISDPLHAAIKGLDFKWQYHAAALERERMRTAAAQEDVMDGVPLAQVEPFRTLNRLSDIERQLRFVQDSSDQLTTSVRTLIHDGSNFESELRSLEHSLAETQNKLYKEGVFQRPRHK